LHRGCQTGLARLRKAGNELEKCLLLGIDPAPLLRRQNRDFCAANLTMGGVADLLGLTFGYLNFSIARNNFSVLRQTTMLPSGNVSRCSDQGQSFRAQ